MRISLVILAIATCGSCFELVDPEEDGVEFVDEGTVRVDEDNNGGRVNIVKLTGVTGTVELTDYTGNGEVLDAKPENRGDHWMITGNRVDYEKLDKVKFFNLGIADDATRAPLNVQIVNIDDESPTLSSAACSMEENIAIGVENSQCSFQVSDSDGWLNLMNFEGINGTKNEIDLFELKYRTPLPSDTDTEADVYLVVKDGKELDYEKIALYSFHVEAMDNAGHSTVPLASVPIIVQVIDMPDQPPVWQTIQTAKTILEKTETTIQVVAKDGDIGIDNDIRYEIIPEEFASINAEGLITVVPINRDAGYDQVTLNVTAIEVQQEDSKTTASILLIIEDADDSIPEITSPGFPDKLINVTIDEGASQITLNISVNDLDLGENAMYSIKLAADNTDFLSALAIIPGNGYQRTQLALTVTDPPKLDYEKPDWQVINLTLHTEGTKTPANKDTAYIIINLNDINDETPKFNQSVYNFKVEEGIGLDEVIAYIKAVDADAEDVNCPHQIVGTLGGRILEIEEYGGNVTTKVEDAFDYEKQTEVIVQITATDKANPMHTGTAQLTIEVQDVNDENPKLSVTSAIEIDENQVNGTVLDVAISASDEDTTADLEFSIFWNESYATKNSQRLKEEDFHQIYDCIIITTNPGSSNHEAIAQLTLNETQIDNTPDYEVYDTLYIHVVVTDKNTERNSGIDSTKVAINILNINDNPPIFADNTATLSRRVTENSPNGTTVTTVLATDKDIDSDITYSIEPKDDTPNWVEIDKSGSISVYLPGDDKIDCDKPNERDNLTYTVTASDGKFNTSVDITIGIIDQNDCVPEMGAQTKNIIEDNNLDPDNTKNGTEVITLKPSDNDRDVPYHTVACSFDPTTTADVTNRFKVENNVISVFLTNGAKLDREEFPSFTFNLYCLDDPTHQGPTSFSINPSPSVTINLDDVNDNIPKIKDGFQLQPITENSVEDQKADLRIEGDDPDEGENGIITFEIVKVERSKTADNSNPEDITDYFSIKDDANGKDAILTATKSLRDKWGFLSLTIITTDKGTPPLKQTNTIQLQVLRFNFASPKFLFPIDGRNYYLKPLQSTNSQLLQYNSENFPDLSASDQQGDKYRINFTVVEDSSGTNLFKIQRLSDTKGQLQVTSILDKLNYDLVLQAVVDHDTPQAGEAPFEVNCTIKIGLLDYNSTEPVFEKPSDTATFKENSLTESHQIDQATYPNITDIQLTPYYFLRNGNDTIFAVDVNTGIVTLLAELDFETEKTYPLTIQASHSFDGYNPTATDDTRLALTVTVVDVNDETPCFDQDKYFGTLLTGGSKTVLSVHATDIDTTSAGRLTYSIKKVSTSSSSLDGFASTGFTIGASSGEISVQFEVKDTMEGYFTLDVEVTDEPPESHTNTTTVKLYLVTSTNTVRFNFGNDQETVDSKEADVKSVLQEQFGYETYVEKTTRDSNSSANSPRTIASVYFIDVDSNVPIDGVDIYRKVTNVDTFTQLKNKFLESGLLLLSFNSETETQNMEEMLKAWLIGVSVVLGAFCLILLIAFILKTRSLNQRITKLSSTKFGSQESGLNRQGISAPTTNKHAVEGSNPVYEVDVDTKEIDRRSITSGDSDLIGVEDDDKFNYDEFEFNKEIND